MGELDRATGGGFVRGSAVLIGGDPGIGKSTLLMQAAAALARRGHRVIYVSGEEAVAQVRLRAQRLGAADTDVLLAAETNVEDILATISEGKRPDLVIIDEAFNSDKLIEFLEALIKDAGKKVFLILDNLRVHHSKPVKAWAAERQDRIELFYLPSYSPELNPEERLNADLKHAIGTKVPVRTKAKLKLAASEHMTKLEQSPERVKSFFQDPRVKYAA